MSPLFLDRGITGVMSLWWLSFCDPKKPEGSQFLGACVVPAGTFLDAVLHSRAFGCNPGGECQGHPIAENVARHLLPKWRLRLLSLPECEAMDADLMRVYYERYAPS